MHSNAQSAVKAQSRASAQPSHRATKRVFRLTFSGKFV